MVIVITGVTRGLGRALAEWYIANGHTVVGCGRSAEILELRFTYSAPHDFSVVDVTEENKVALWSDKVIGAHGAPDILVNNAALMNTPAPLWKVPAAEFNKLVDVNLKGVEGGHPAFCPGDGRARPRRNCELQLHPGPQRLGGDRALLREQVCGRGLDEGAGARIACGDGRGAAEPRVD